MNNMRFYIGDKVLPRPVKTETTKYYGVITDVNYEYKDRKPNNDSDIEYSVTWLDVNTKEFAYFTQNTPKNAWWSYSSLKRIKLKDIKR
jgi:hypothetical protein